MIGGKSLVLFGTNRHAICVNDYYMFFKRTPHSIDHIFYPVGSHKNRDWWEIGKRTDPARDSAVEPMDDYEGQITIWEELERDVYPVLDKMEFDFICLGNGTDEAHKAIVDHVGRDKVLFTEYGWLPWSRNFYISRQGAGVASEIASIPVDHLDSLTVNNAEIAGFHSVMNAGNPVQYEDFIYMPLQKDVNDFKFLYNDFSDNPEYLRFVEGIVPQGLKILVKSHPLYPKQYDLSFSDRMIDITHADLNKHELYTRMRAMVCLNSTSILEALSYNARVFSYGDDLFVGKGITHHKVKDAETFSENLSAELPGARSQKFVSLLLSRQVDRLRCISDDRAYVAKHYWNICL